VIAQLVQADEDTVRDVIHRFNEIGLDCLDPQWAGGRPRLLSRDDEGFVIQTATTRPAKLGQPFTRWSVRKLLAYLRRVPGRVVRIGREALRCLLARRGITFQRTKTWKESTDPQRDTKLDRIEHVLENFPDRTFAFDEFGPLGIRPTAGSCWDAAPPRKTSSTMTRAPAWVIAATPSIHAASSVRNSGPAITSPSAANSIPAAEVRMDTGIAWISVSIPRASHGSGKTACRHRAIPDFPELEPPLRTIT